MLKMFDVAYVMTSPLAAIASGRRDFVKQDPEKASFFHKRSIEDSRMDFGWPAADLERLVRAQSDPYPNAFCYHGSTRLRIVAASVSHDFP
jgi:methionyl-tRNA formyltransferase